MSLPPEGIWRYPPTRAFLLTVVVVFAGLWFIGYYGENENLAGRALVLLFIAVPVAALNALYVEVIVRRERDKLAALQMDVLMGRATHKDSNAHRT